MTTQLLERLTHAQPLWALVDAARDSQILAFLDTLDKTAYQSLYQGQAAEQLAGFAPYLITLSANPAGLARLIDSGWGNSWGIYLTSKSPVQPLHQHLRQFLLIKNQSGKQLYFRFYDPRVLRQFLPTCTPTQLKDFFGPIDDFFLEGANSEQLLHWQLSGFKYYNLI